MEQTKERLRQYEQSLTELWNLATMKKQATEQKPHQKLKPKTQVKRGSSFNWPPKTR